MWRVKDWDALFENSRTRCYERLTWVPIPNKHDGDGYTQLVEHEHGATHYGAWCVLVQVASKCKPRGTLIRDGGVPHDANSLSRLTRIGAHVFREAIPRFLQIGWLEDVNDSCLSAGCQGAKSTCQNGAPGTEPEPEKNGTGKEKKNRPAGMPVGFLESWDSDHWQTAQRMHVEAVKKLWPKRNWAALPMKPEDRALLLKAAYVAVTKLSPDWWHAALEETLRSEPRKPLGLFKTCLWKRPRAEGLDLNAMLDAVRIPEKPEAGK